MRSSRSEDADLFRRDPTLDPIAAGDAHAERLPARPGLAGRGRHFKRVRHAVGEAAAVGIDASVGNRRQKAVHQKAVGSEQFDEIKAEPVGVPGGVRVSVANTRQIGLVERLRGGPVIVKRDRRWRCRRPGAGVQGERPTALPRAARPTPYARHGQAESRAPLNPRGGKSRQPAPAPIRSHRNRVLEWS